MIKNIIFDIGNVLIDYMPHKLMNHFELDGDGRELFFKYVFDSELWLDLDRGVCDFAHAIDEMRKHIPYEKQLRFLFTDESFDIIFAEKPDTVALMRGLKRDGYKLYLLSNFSREGFDYITRRFDFLSEFDGRVISSHVGLIKPDPAIYRCLLDKYSLAASESIFFDDLPANCESAIKVGVKAFVFRNANEARSILKEELL